MITNPCRKCGVGYNAISTFTIPNGYTPHWIGKHQMQYTGNLAICNQSHILSQSLYTYLFRKVVQSWGGAQIVASTNVIPGIILVIFCDPIECFFKKIDEVPVISQFGLREHFFSLPRKKFIKYLGILLIVLGILFGFIVGSLLEGNSVAKEAKISQQIK